MTCRPPTGGFEPLRAHLATHGVTDSGSLQHHLGDDERGATRWTVDEIGFLGELLDTAAAEGMAVLLLSDHGHVVDRRDRRARHATGAWRCRPVSAI